MNLHIYINYEINNYFYFIYILSITSLTMVCPLIFKLVLQIGNEILIYNFIFQPNQIYLCTHSIRISSSIWSKPLVLLHNWSLKTNAETEKRDPVSYFKCESYNLISTLYIKNNFSYNLIFWKILLNFLVLFFFF